MQVSELSLVLPRLIYNAHLAIEERYTATCIYPVRTQLYLPVGRVRQCIHASVEQSVESN